MGLKFDGVDFNNDWAASIDEAAFIESMKEPVAYPWRKITPEERESKLKEVHTLILSHANSSGATETSTGGGSDRSDGGGNNGKSKDDSGQKQISTDQSGRGQEQRTASTVQKPNVRTKKEE